MECQRAVRRHCGLVGGRVHIKCVANVKSSMVGWTAVAELPIAHVKKKGGWCRGCKAQPSHHQSQYHSTDTPVTKFGYSTDFEEKYELGDVVGSGTFGKVFKAVEKASGKEFAVKRMPKRFGAAGGAMDKYYVRRIRNEVDIGSHLGRSLNIAYMYAAFEDDSNVDIVMELCCGGTLWDAILKGDGYTSRDACRLVRDILRVVAQCHSQGVMIRDVKPENFLFSYASRDAPLKAIDFGVSVFCEPDEKVDMRAGTPIYVAPEVLRGEYGLEVDIWSAGIVAYQLLVGKLPFAGEDGSEVTDEYMKGSACANKDIFRAILYSDLDFSDETWSNLSDDARNLVKSMLDRVADNRPTATEALHHVWIQSLDENTQSEVLLEDTVVQRLQRYGTYGNLKQAALRKMAHVAMLSGLTEALNNGLSDARLDIEKQDNRISKLELQSILEGGKFNLSPDEAEQLLSQVAFDDQETVDTDDWIAAMTEWKTVKDSAEWDYLISEVFEEADIDEDEALGIEDLERLLCGDDGCDVEGLVDSAMREADSDGDGSVSFGEFKAFMQNHDTDLDIFDSRMNSSDEN